MVAVIVLTGMNNEFHFIGKTAAFPVTIITAIVSPITRPIPSMIPVKTPLRAAGKVTRHIVCHWVAPHARAASRYDLGTESSASSETDTIVGIATALNKILPANAVSPVGKSKNRRR
jgi:hypothetical protein